MMFEDKDEARNSLETMMPKRMFFVRMIEFFTMEEQYEILRRLFDKGMCIVKRLWLCPTGNLRQDMMIYLCL